MTMDKNNQHIIDKKAYELLKNHEVPFNTEHWKAMEQRLTQLDADEMTFDESLKQKITDSSIAFDTRHWSLMYEKLQQLDANDTNFDTSVRNAIAAAETPYNVQHWALMENELEQIDTNDAAFDSNLRDVLKDKEIPFNPQHWGLMQQQIEQTFSWKAKIIRFKVLETTLMLLLLLTAYNIVDNGQNPFHISKKDLFDNTVKQSEIEKITDPQSIKDIKSNQSDKKIESKRFNQDTDWRNKGQQQLNNKINNNVPIVSTEIEIDNKKDSGEKSLLVASVNPDKLSSVSETSKNSQNTAATEVKNNNFDVAPLLPLIEKKLIAFDEAKQLPNMCAHSPVQVIVAVAEPVAVLRPKALTITALYDEPIVSRSSKKGKWWRLGIFGGVTADYVTSSFKHQGALTEWGNISTNNGGGISIGRKQGKFEIASGISFHPKTYQTSLPDVIITGAVVTGRADRTALPKIIDLDIVRIPLSINYSLKEAGRWNIFTSLGASFNAATRIDIQHYSINDATSFRTQTINLRGISALPEYGEPFKIGLSKNVNNFYYSVAAGIGAEYKFSPWLSTYLQSSYERPFSKSGIGSRSDKINTLNLEAGIKMRISKDRY